MSPPPSAPPLPALASVDPTTRRLLLDWQKRVLDVLLVSQSTAAALEALVRLIEEVHPEMVCAVMLVDGNRLTFGAGPSLPEFYHQAVEGLAIGDGVGSCGTAAARGEPVIVADILSHPYWADYRELMAQTGLAACWSQPIKGRDGRVLGTFAIYYREVRQPSPEDLEQIAHLSDLAALIIEVWESESALEHSERRLQRLTATIPGVIYEYRLHVDGRGEFPYISPGIREMTGLDPETVMADPGAVFALLHPDDRAALHQANLRNSDGSVDEWNGEMRLDTPQGQRWIKAHAIRDTSAAPADGSTLWSGLLTDITREKTAELALARSNAELETFAHAVSHDLREPLRMVSSYLRLLERRLGPDLGSEAAEFLDFARDGAHRMNRQIEGLLAYARVSRQVPAAVEVDLDLAVTAALDNLVMAVAESGASVSIAGLLPTVRGDPDQLALVFQNLLANALKFRHPERPPRVVISAREVPGAWRIEVTDNGLGVPDDQAERLFGIFQRGHPAQSVDGTGVGLALVKRIVEHHGGSVGVDPGPDDQGACFHITLPREA
ncbi:sensor histidine kinase [Roseospirillum parvum]|uniref:histidine kinase n=1 Tax=Roseospirillum parvum TaxID=83401 RepID=A0A1G7YHL3_9PROT|nr:ATP-binding protein [Roseospirillum parvum]SDG95887.1 cardiolipin synthase [Roseospirillum parvum]